MQTTEPQRPATDIAVTYKVKITPKLVWAILAPYVWEKAEEQLWAVVPISAFLVLFQVVVMRQGIVHSLEIGLGLGAVILGLMFFLEGMRLGLMPLGETIGASLPEKAGLWLVLGFSFIVGVAATLAEPAVPNLKLGGEAVQPDQAPLLYDMLTRNSTLLLGAVAVGVGFATQLGIFRFVRNWGLKVLLLPSIAVCVALTVLAEINPATSVIVALAWDAGGVTTGPVTVPLVLALGLGVSAVLGKSDTGMSGFGIVTLASLWPVATVLLLGLGMYYGGMSLNAADALALAEHSGHAAAHGEVSITQLFTNGVYAAAQALIPLALLLYVVQRFVLGEEVNNVDQILVGIGFALFGLLLFHVGLHAGLGPLGQQAGSSAPSAFAPPVALYGETGGKLVILAFAGLLGYAATLAEPPLHSMGHAVEEVTAGAFKKGLLIHTVAAGVGVGLAIGVGKILFGWSLAWLIIPCYLIVTVLTIFSDEEFTNIGWDAAGVTTGEITVPLVMAMGLGIGVQVGAVEGFGMLALASVVPIMTFLALGLVVRFTRRMPKPHPDARPHEA